MVRFDTKPLVKLLALITATVTVAANTLVGLSLHWWGSWLIKFTLAGTSVKSTNRPKGWAVHFVASVGRH